MHQRHRRAALPDPYRYLVNRLQSFRHFDFKVIQFGSFILFEVNVQILCIARKLSSIFKNAPHLAYVWTIGARKFLSYLSCPEFAQWL